MKKRKGRIDQIEDFQNMDLIAFNGGVNPWNNPFITAGFKPGIRYFRTVVEKWGFEGYGNVADVGSGYGRWSVFLGEANTKVVGYERVVDAVELSRKLAKHLKLTNTRFEAAEVTAMPAKDNSFDAVWCYNGLHLFPRVDCLNEMRRILKPGGALFLGAYNGIGTALEKFFEGYKKGGLDDFLTKFALGSILDCEKTDANHFTCATEKGVTNVLEQFGFDISKDRPIWSQKRGGVPVSQMFADEMEDVPAFMQRVVEDEALRTEFVRHPDIAHRYPVNLDVLAIKR